jgi:hypothetical protein
MLFVALFLEGYDFLDQDGKVVLDSIPHPLVTDDVVAMNENIPEINDLMMTGDFEANLRFESKEPLECLP